MGGGVPILAIIRRDIAPVLARRYYALSGADEELAALTLANEALDGPKTTALQVVLEKAEGVGIMADISALEYFAEMVLELTEEILGNTAIMAERANMPSSVYAKVVRDEYELMLSLATMAYIPDISLIREVIGMHAPPGFSLN